VLEVVLFMDFKKMDLWGFKKSNDGFMAFKKG
jgi:hypothetical protein